MPTHTVEDELLELENQYWQAIKDKDTETAMRLTDDSCILTGAQGVRRLDKLALAGMMNSGGFTLHKYTVSDVQTRIVSDDVAIIAYNVHEELTADGQRVSLDASDASTWIRRDGRWLCALHTESIAGDPFGRDKKPIR